MNQRLNELLIRRGRLLERIATKRAALGHDMPALRSGLYTVDRIVAGVRSCVGFIKQQPSIVTVAGAVLVSLKPGRIVR